MSKQVCNICGKGLDIFAKQQKFRMDVPYIGYGSIHDGESFHMTMCNRCFDKFIDRTTFQINPFSMPDISDSDYGTETYTVNIVVDGDEEQ